MEGNTNTRLGLGKDTFTGTPDITQDVKGKPNPEGLNNSVRSIPED